MKNAINVTGHVMVSDILTAFEPMLEADLLASLDKALEGRTDEKLKFDDTDVLIEDAIDGLEYADALPDPEAIFDETDIINLAEAIRCGETERAELLLERVFRDMPNATAIREWIDRGRFSKKAREAKAAAQAKPRLRSAA
jgi:hypothetical protein